MRSYLPPVAGAMAVFLIGLSILLWRQEQAMVELGEMLARAEAKAQQALTAAAAEKRDYERRLDEANRRFADLQVELDLARAAAERTGDDTARLRNDPAYLEVRQRQQRRIVQERYGEFFTRLDLPAETLERFKQLLVELADSGRASPPREGAESPEAEARTRAAIEAELRTLLGEETYVAYQGFGYELTQVRPQVNRFSNDAADAGVPLSTVQRSALSRAIFEATDPRRLAPDEFVTVHQPDEHTGLTPLDQRVLANAADVLSPAQLELFRTFRVQERMGLDAWRRLATP